MRIVKVDVTPVSVPCTEPVVWRFGVIRGVSTVVVRLRTNDGLEGIGEAPGSPSMAVVLAALDFFSPALIGEDPMSIRPLLHRMRIGGAGHFPYVANVALAAFEMALWDLCGKALARPAYVCLGGAMTRSFPFYWHVNSLDGSPESAAEQAIAGTTLGFSTLYLKGGTDIEADLRMAEAVRSAVGNDINLRIDPNEGWNRLAAIKCGDRIAALHLEFLEQPFVMDNLISIKEFKRTVQVPVAANQGAWRIEDVNTAIAAQAADVVVTGLHQTGGIVRLLEAEVLCSVAGIPLVRHSMCDLGIGTAAALQALAVCRPGQLAHQTHLTLVEHDLLEDQWCFTAGSLELRTGAGLGVQVDTRALQNYARCYRTNGEYAAYSPGATASE